MRWEATRVGFFHSGTRELSGFRTWTAQLRIGGTDIHRRKTVKRIQHNRTNPERRVQPEQGRTPQLHIPEENSAFFFSMHIVSPEASFAERFGV